MNVFEAVLHQQECGRNLRRSRVLELLCPEAPGFQGSTAASHPCPTAPEVQGGIAPMPPWRPRSPARLPPGSEAPRLPSPRAFRLPLSATATLPERSQTEWV